MSSKDPLHLLKSILLRSSFPLNGQIEFFFHKKKGCFALSSCIFEPPSALPDTIEQYIAKREGYRFLPYSTRFEKKENKVFLIQEIPFSETKQQKNLRRHAANFRMMVQSCHHMFKEMALEEVSQELFDCS